MITSDGKKKREQELERCVGAKGNQKKNHPCCHFQMAFKKKSSASGLKMPHASLNLIILWGCEQLFLHTCNRASQVTKSDHISK